MNLAEQILAGVERRYVLADGLPYTEGTESFPSVRPTYNLSLSLLSSFWRKWITQGNCVTSDTKLHVVCSRKIFITLEIVPESLSWLSFEFYDAPKYNFNGSWVDGDEFEDVLISMKLADHIKSVAIRVP